MKITHGSDGTDIELTIDEVHELLNKQWVVGGDVTIALAAATGDMLFTSLGDGKVTKFRAGKPILSPVAMACRAQGPVRTTADQEPATDRVAMIDQHIASRNAKHFASPTRDRILYAEDQVVDTFGGSRPGFREIDSKPGEPRRFIRE